MGILIAIIVLSLLIFFHELGHFIAARIMGVTVEVFSIGFGKTLYAKTIGDTEYRISAVWLGGYVKMKGQDDANPLKKSGEPDAYDTKKPWQRMFILFAGPFANFVLAYVVFVWVALIGFDALSPTIGKVLENSPAERAMLQVDDQIISVESEPVLSWDEMSKMIKSSEGAITLGVLRNGEILTLVLTPDVSESENIFGEKEQRKMIGIAPSGALVTLHYSVLESFGVALDKTIDASTLVFMSLIKLITGVVGVENVGGIITIVDFTAKASAIGFAVLLSFSAILSVNLGILNLLPIPALDGGHLMFALYEQVRGRAPSESVFYKMTVAGWGILGALMLLGIFNDITRLLK